MISNKYKKAIVDFVVKLLKYEPKQEFKLDINKRAEIIFEAGYISDSFVPDFRDALKHYSGSNLLITYNSQTLLDGTYNHTATVWELKS